MASLADQKHVGVHCFGDEVAPSDGLDRIDVLSAQHSEHTDTDSDRDDHGDDVLSPMLAAAAMSLSSVCVIGNALRLRTPIPSSTPAAVPAPHD
jgi:cation transport ATPase